MGRGNFEGKGALIAVSCAKTAEPTDGDAVWDLDSSGPKEARGSVHTGATWRIPPNLPCAAAMRPVVKLL